MSLPSRPAILVRISDARDDDTGTIDDAGVRRQEHDARELAARLGWPEPVVYRENDTSAYKRRTVTLPDGNKALRTNRPVFRELLADMMSGQVDGLIAYDLDRVARDHRDLADLIDVVESRKISVDSVTGSLRLANDSDIAMAWIMVTVANKASRDTSRRVLRKHEELAEQGKPGGGGKRAYGYDTHMTLLPSEAEVIRRIADDILAGRSLSSIATKLTAEGIPAALGGPWNARSVHSVVTKSAVAGLRTFRGKVVGDATWTAILSRDTWMEVKSTLADRANGNTNQFLYWLGGVLVCGKCGHRLQSSTVGKRGSYWCASTDGGCAGTRIDRGHSDATVEALLLAYLGRADVLAALNAAKAPDDSRDLRAVIEDAQAQLVTLAKMYGDQDITLAEYVAARKPVQARLSDAQQTVSRSLPGAVRTLIAADDVAAAWEGLEPAERRQVALAVFPAGLEVLPHRKGAPRVFDPARIRPIAASS